MNLADLINQLLQNQNEERAVAMRAYMRDQFAFLGIPTPQRKELCKPYFKHAKKSGAIDWVFVQTCWASPYRELQYLAVNYLTAMQSALTPQDIPAIKNLAVTKSWWDTIDGIDKIIGDIALANPDQNDLLLQWSTDDNMWLRRIAIDHQRMRKEKTDTKLLELIIKNNLGSTEFFINKAIGWALREYSKTNPQWVQQFINKNKDNMAKLSIREASKYL